jgi:hypothetical protein
METIVKITKTANPSLILYHKAIEMFVFMRCFLIHLSKHLYNWNFKHIKGKQDRFYRISSFQFLFEHLVTSLLDIICKGLKNIVLEQISS